MTVIGLTGSIGSGKTTCSNFAADHGFSVFDCDEQIAEHLQDPDFQLRLMSEFDVSGHIDWEIAKPSIMQRSDFRNRSSPLLRARIENAFAVFENDKTKSSPIIIDTALLFEWKLDKNCDVTVCLCCPPEQRRKRVLSRIHPSMSSDDFTAVTVMQMSDYEKRSRADIIFDTNRPINQMCSEFLVMISELVRK